MEYATPDDLTRINGLIDQALSDDDPDRADEAAASAFRHMRRFGLEIECKTTKGYGDESRPPMEPPPLDAMALDEAGDMVLPFGRHQGETLREVLCAEVKYFWWLANKADITNPNLAEAIETVWNDRKSYGVN